jgi:hypothetical protein
MKTYGKSTYIHAGDITGVEAGQATLTDDRNRKLHARSETVMPIAVKLINGDWFEALIVNRCQVGPGYQRHSLWLTNGPNDEYHFCYDAMDKIAESLNMPDLQGEPLGSGSYRRWAGELDRPAEAQFMTGMLLAQ